MLLQQLVNGLTLGVIYSLLALGYTLIFGTLSFINFAHGEVAMVGTYFAWYGFAKLGIPFLPACLFAILIAGIVGIIIERFGYKPIRNSARLAMITVSVGFSFIIQIALQAIFGTEPYEFSIGSFTTYNIGEISFNSLHIWVLLLSLICMISLQLFIHYTKPGRSIRAISLDKDTANLMGVNVDYTISLTFFIGSALAAISGIMMAMYYAQLYPTMGATVSDKAFAAVVLGGAGSVPGAMIGGVAMGAIESLAGTILNAQLREGVSFVVLILILIFKPSGLLGKEVVKD